MNEYVQIPVDDFERMTEALKRISEIQPRTLEQLRNLGVVFTDMGHDPKNWQHVAFSIYTDLCEADMIARTALP